MQNMNAYCTYVRDVKSGITEKHFLVHSSFIDLLLHSTWGQGPYSPHKERSHIKQK